MGLPGRAGGRRRRARRARGGARTRRGGARGGRGNLARAGTRGPGLVLPLDPPPVEIRRYSTWFFAAKAPEADVVIDEGEITDSQWIRPDQAIARQRAGEIEFVPPTFVTLHYLARHGSVASALGGLVPAAGPRRYVTKIAKSDAGMVVMWEGDAGYDALDASLPGPRHRLVMGDDGFAFDDSGLGSGEPGGAP